jgi:hypothetical protein
LQATDERIVQHLRQHCGLLRGELVCDSPR